MERLPQGLVGGLGLGRNQLLWLLASLALTAGIGALVRSDAWLRLYKYTWAALGVGLLLMTFVFGHDVNGQRLALSIGPLTGQPSELLKVILVVFLAGYLSENRPLLMDESTRIGPIRLPPLPYLAPMIAMWAVALSIVLVQGDLGAALLFFAVFLILLYVATARASYVALGMVAFLAGGFVLYQIVPHVRTRVDIWIDPFATAQTTGYQVVQALHAFARGGILGTGLGAGLPAVGGLPPGGIPGPAHRLPVRRARRGARPRRDHGDPRAVPRRHRARAPDRRVRGGRLPGHPRRRAQPRRSASRRSSSRPATSSSSR